MRKYKAKRRDNGNWVFGDLVYEPWGICIQRYKN